VEYLVVAKGYWCGPQLCNVSYQPNRQ